jgi:hypothetical protein
MALKKVGITEGEYEIKAIKMEYVCPKLQLRISMMTLRIDSITRCSLESKHKRDNHCFTCVPEKANCRQKKKHNVQSFIYKLKIRYEGFKKDLRKGKKSALRSKASPRK